MMDKDLIKNYIESGIECEYLDFKSDIYDFKNQNQKENFITDIISFANAHSPIDKYIIIGVKLLRDGSRTYRCIDMEKVQDGADYQSLITNNIEPTITIDFDIIEHDNNKFGVFKISKDNRDRPYCLSKQFGSLKKGYLRIRKGQQNAEVIRRDYDLFYRDSVVENKSEIKVKGILTGEKSDVFILGDYVKPFDNSNLVKEIVDSIQEVNKIIIPEETEITNLEKTNSSIINLIRNIPKFGTPLKFPEDSKKIIEKYAKEKNLHLNPNFFELGDFRYFSMSEFTGTTYYGSDDSKEKYRLLKAIRNKISDLVIKENFNRNLLKINYTEFAIENSGKVYDEDIEVCLTIQKSDFINFDEFPAPRGDVLNEIIRNDILDDYICIKKYKNISSYRSKERGIKPIAPTSYTLPTGQRFSPPYESMKEYYYELIFYEADYDIVETSDEIILKYVQKDIKPNEIVSFPSKIFLNNSVNKVTYTIKSKHNPDIMNGEVSVLGKK